MTGIVAAGQILDSLHKFLDPNTETRNYEDPCFGAQQKGPSF